jgi:hypothetical protein
MYGYLVVRTLVDLCLRVSLPQNCRLWEDKNYTLINLFYDQIGQTDFSHWNQKFGSKARFEHQV